MLLAVGLMMAPVAFAACPEGTTCENGENEDGTTTFTGKIINPLTGKPAGEEGAQKSTTQIIGKAINIALGFVGGLALLVFIIGGSYWVVSLGNDERIKKGRDAMTWAAIGLLLVFSSYAVLNFVLGSFSGLGG